MNKLKRMLKATKRFNLKEITYQHIAVLFVVLGVVAVGVHFIISSFAASPFSSIGASNGTLGTSGSATVQTCASGSTGQCVQFGSALAVRISGDQLVNGQGQDIRLLGTDASGPEYCSFTNSIGDGDPLDSAEAEDIASWKMNAVRIPLNEDCWLGIPGIYINTTVNGVNEELTGAKAALAYQTGIENWVTDLNDDGIIAILDLHHAAPKGHLANIQWPMADADYSPGFWTSVATAFKSNPAVMFDLYNEPFIGTSQGPIVGSVSPWACWLNGCNVSFAGNTNNPISPAVTYATAGMQQLVNAVRATGATQPIIVGGLHWSGDPCGLTNKFGSTAVCTEVANMPKDPLNQLAIDFHNYVGGTCNTATCWSTTLQSIHAANLPMVTDEFGEDDCSDSFMNAYMTWADQNNESYLAWSWVPPVTLDTTCSTTDGPDTGYGYFANYAFLDSFSSGTPDPLIPQAANYKAHLALPSVYGSE